MNEKIEMIRQLAYYIWQQEGQPPDRALQNWLEAESTVGGVKRKPAKRSTGKTAAKQAKTAKASTKKGAATDKTKKRVPKKDTKRTRKKS